MPRMIGKGEFGSAASALVSAAIRPFAELSRGVLSVTSVSRVVSVASGKPKAGLTSLFSVFRDEEYFCRAFFSHYRSLGVEQFVILDDGSVDGTLEFLRAQPDCVVLRSSVGFGDKVVYRSLDGSIRRSRAGVYFKVAVPLALLPGEYVTYVDADEFLLLPPGVASLSQVIDRLRASGSDAALASVVEFFPEALDETRSLQAPADLSSLMAQMPWFEAEPLIELRSDGSYAKIAPSKSRRLFERFQIARGLPRGKSDLRNSPRHKMPVLLQTARTGRTGSHGAMGRLCPDAMLCLAHFVFNPRWEEKIARARERRTHSDGGAKYDLYARLHAAMVAEGGSFLGLNSKRYAGPEDLAAAGLVKW